MAKKQDRVIQTRLGKMTVEPDKIIYFPKGLIGYQDKREFTLLQIRDDSPFMLLQSLNDPSLGLLVADPFMFLAEYTVKIGGAEQKILQLDNRRQMGVLVTVSIPAGHPEETTLNLIGPIIINTKKKIGTQVPQTDMNYPSNVRLDVRPGRPPAREPEGPDERDGAPGDGEGAPGGESAPTQKTDGQD